MWRPSSSRSERIVNERGLENTDSIWKYEAMDQTGIIGRGTFLRRALIAIVLTGIVSPLLLAVGTAAFFLFADKGNNPPHDATSALGFVAIIWFFGSLVGTACAALLGLFVEWPKVKWLKSSAIWQHLLTSMAGAEILLLTWTAISVAIRPPSSISSELGSGVLFVAIAAAIGGGCSAVFWWKLVTTPMRKAKEV